MQNQLSTIAFDNLVKMHNQEVTTTSNIVAEFFEKQHKHVLAKIDEIIAQTPAKFNEPNFRLIENDVKVGFGVRKERAFEITKDGFMLLVMGFTGKKAMELKICFIEAFNWAFEQLHKVVTTTDRTPLRQAVSLLVGKKGLAYDDACRLVHQYMSVAHIDEIALDDLPKAVEYIHRLLLTDDKKQNDALTADTQNLAWTALVITSWYRAIEPHFRALSPQLCGEIHDHMTYARVFAGGIQKQIGLGQMTDKLPLLENKRWAVRQG